jgi:hypothetical protein
VIARLARLWPQQGMLAAASALLAPLNGWCTEGCDTVGLHAAQALREALAASGCCCTSPNAVTPYSRDLAVPRASSPILPVAYAMMEPRM